MSASGGVPGGALVTPNADVPATTGAQVVGAELLVFDSSGAWRQVQSARQLGDGNVGAFCMSTVQAAKNGATYDQLRTPNVFKSADGTGATFTVWTPGSGKKFRLMRFAFGVSANASVAVAGVTTFTVKDGAGGTVLLGADFFIPGAAGALVGEQSTPWLDLGNGILSATANNVLQFSGTALATGTAWCIAIGTEE